MDSLASHNVGSLVHDIFIATQDEFGIPETAVQHNNDRFMWTPMKISLPVNNRVSGFNSHIPIQLHLSALVTKTSNELGRPVMRSILPVRRKILLYCGRRIWRLDASRSHAGY